MIEWVDNKRKTTAAYWFKADVVSYMAPGNRQNEKKRAAMIAGEYMPSPPALMPPPPRAAPPPAPMPWAAYVE